VLVTNVPGATAFGVALSKNYAYLARSSSGLHIFDISNPTNCVFVGACDTPGSALGVAASREYAFVADGPYGLQVMDLTDPTNCVLAATYQYPRFGQGSARRVTVASDRIYVAGDRGLLVLPTLANVQVTIQVTASPATPFTLEAATDLSGIISWAPILSTNAPTMPFDYVDFDVKNSVKPKKFYRITQP
jgi:hypothetical protein